MTDWTDERVEQLKELYAEGWSSSQIAEKLGVTRNAIIGKTNRLKLRRQPVLRQARRYQPVVVPRKPRDAKRQYAEVEAEPREMNRQCRWPIGDPRLPGFHFCDAPSSGTYCAEHHALAHAKKSA